MRLADHQPQRAELFGAAGGISAKPAPQYGVALALLDDPPARPALHCFVASKAPWFEITDELPQYPEYPPLNPPLPGGG